MIRLRDVQLEVLRQAGEPEVGILASNVAAAAWGCVSVSSAMGEDAAAKLAQALRDAARAVEMAPRLASVVPLEVARRRR